MKTLNFLILFLMTSGSFAQNFVDLANVYYRMSPQNSSENSAEKINYNTFAFDAKLPIQVNDNNLILFALEYHQQFFENPILTLGHSRLTSLGMQLGGEHKWNDKFKTLALGIARFNTNYTDKTFRNNFQMGGVILNKYKRNDKFEWKYGLYFNNELFAPMFVPLFGFIWQINEKTKLNITVPVNFELSYVINKKIRSGLRFDGANGSYRTQVAGNQYYIDRADNNVSLFNDFYVTKNLVFHLKVGYSIIRKYRRFDINDRMNLKLGPINVGDNRVEEDIWFKDGYSFEVRMIFRLPLD